MTVTLAELVEVIRGHTYNFISEVDLQDGIEGVLQQAGIHGEREAELSSKDRIDFLIKDGIGVEVKTKGSTSTLTRQVHRYVQHESIKAMVVVTTVGRLTNIPEVMNGKPIVVVHLIESCL